MSAAQTERLRSTDTAGGVRRAFQDQGLGLGLGLGVGLGVGLSRRGGGDGDRHDGGEDGEAGEDGAGGHGNLRLLTGRTILAERPCSHGPEVPFAHPQRGLRYHPRW